ncbi:hypothetical protein C2S51_002549 [Perilla frutescens var. frutescens]|nr:hypothetical protein C2S51_002549 [Perilla frutescens var. frutescens]
MSVIRKVLYVISSGPELFEQFRKEWCFGHLIDFVGGNSCNNALDALLSKEVIIDGAREHDIWFRVRETNIRFSPNEFALVTGLQFRGSDYDPSASYEIPRISFYSRELKKTPLRVKDLFERFRTYSLGDGVMVANVLFLHTMIFGYDHIHMIDDWVWVLVEDQDRWNSFPWGVYAFSLLQRYMGWVPSTEVELRRKFKKTEENARLSYHFYEPVWDLLVCSQFCCNSTVHGQQYSILDARVLV